MRTAAASLGARKRNRTSNPAPPANLSPHSLCCVATRSERPTRVPRASLCVQAQAIYEGPGTGESPRSKANEDDLPSRRDGVRLWGVFFDGMNFSCWRLRRRSGEVFEAEDDAAAFDAAAVGAKPKSSPRSFLRRAIFASVSERISALRAGGRSWYFARVVRMNSCVLEFLTRCARRTCFGDALRAGGPTAILPFLLMVACVAMIAESVVDLLLTIVNVRMGLVFHYHPPVHSHHPKCIRLWPKLAEV